MQHMQYYVDSQMSRSNRLMRYECLWEEKNIVILSEAGFVVAMTRTVVMVVVDVHDNY